MGLVLPVPAEHGPAAQDPAFAAGALAAHAARALDPAGGQSLDQSDHVESSPRGAIWTAGRTVSAGLWVFVAALFVIAFALSHLPTPGRTPMWRRVPGIPGPARPTGPQESPRRFSRRWISTARDPLDLRAGVAPVRSAAAARSVHGDDGAHRGRPIQLCAMPVRAGRRGRPLALSSAAGARLAVAAGEGCGVPDGAVAARPAAGAPACAGRGADGVGGWVMRPR